MKKSIIYISFLVALFVFYACKTTKNVAEKPVVETIKKETPPAGKQEIKEMNYDWFSSRVNVSIVNLQTNRESLSFSAFLVIRKDSIIYLNANKMGIELVRAVLTPDTVKFVNTLNSTYYLGEYAFLQKMIGFPVDFFILQSLLTNADFVDFENNFTFVPDSSMLVHPHRKHKKTFIVLDQKIKLDSNGRINENHILEKNINESMSLTYSEFANLIAEQTFPVKIELLINKLQTKVILRLKNPKINTPGPTSIHIPKKFKPVF